MSKITHFVFFFYLTTLYECTELYTGWGMVQTHFHLFPILQAWTMCVEEVRGKKSMIDENSSKQRTNTWIMIVISFFSCNGHTHTHLRAMTHDRGDRMDSRRGTAVRKWRDHYDDDYTPMLLVISVALLIFTHFCTEKVHFCWPLKETCMGEFLAESHPHHLTCGTGTAL